MTKAFDLAFSFIFILIDLWTIYSLLPWATELIIVFSFFAFIPMIPFLIPFLGPLMIVKKWKMVIGGFVASLGSIWYLKMALSSYPIRLYNSLDYMPRHQYLLILLSLLVYLVYAVLFFVVRAFQLVKMQGKSVKDIIKMICQFIISDIQ